MITHIQVVTVYVSDQDKALDFYVNTLGFEKRTDSPMGLDMRWLEVAPPGSTTTLVLARGHGGWAPEKVGGFTGVALAADDIHATHDELKERGVEFTESPTMQPWGMLQAQFVDLDRNGFVLVQQLDAP